MGTAIVSHLQWSQKIEPHPLDAHQTYHYFSSVFIDTDLYCSIDPDHR